jgi:hypothetical protein
VSVSRPEEEAPHALQVRVRAHDASLRVMAKARFAERGSGIEPGTRRFRRTKAAG